MLGKLSVLILAGILLLGCEKNDHISVYTVKKESAVSMLPQAAPVKSELKWVLPEGWKEVAASEMRILSVQIQNLSAKALDFSVVKLAGEGGGLLMNVNRWRNQLELPPLSEEALQKAVQTQVLGQFSFNTIEITSQNKEKVSLVGVLYLDGESYFFKLTGDKANVQREKTHFYDFLKGLKRA